MDFDVKRYAELARVRLSAEETKKLGGDLQKVLDHFTELQGLNTEKVKPMTGGTSLKNIFREDKIISEDGDEIKTKESFPETKDGYLKVPKVFE